MPSALNVVILGRRPRQADALRRCRRCCTGWPAARSSLCRSTRARSSPRAIAVVIGHGGRRRPGDISPRPTSRSCCRIRRAGTGDATRVALDALPCGWRDAGRQSATFRSCRRRRWRRSSARREAGKLAVLTARVPDPSGLGRIVRDAARRACARSSRRRDANRTQRTISEINTGVMAAPTALLRALGRRRSTTGQRAGRVLPHRHRRDSRSRMASRSVAHVPSDERDVRGINDRAQLVGGRADLLQRAQADALIDSGRARSPIPLASTFAARSTCGARRRDRCRLRVRRRRSRSADGVSDRSVLRAAQRDRRRRHAVIEPFSHLDDAQRSAPIAAIGPLRTTAPGATLDDDVHIGNFVEVKASSLGRGSKANHLAYIGDTTVGSGVNYGAGAITANYDGAQQASDDRSATTRSIGSNCVLVAPVTIGTRRDDRRRQHDREGRARRRAHRGARTAGDRSQGWQRPVKP